MDSRQLQLPNCDTKIVNSATTCLPLVVSRTGILLAKQRALRACLVCFSVFSTSYMSLFAFPCHYSSQSFQSTFRERKLALLPSDRCFCHRFRCQRSSSVLPSTVFSLTNLPFFFEIFSIIFSLFVCAYRFLIRFGFV